MQVKKIIQKFISILLLVSLIACSAPAEVMSEERVFLDLSLEYLGEYQLNSKTFQDTLIGGISALTYNPQTGEYYALSDDKSKHNPARFYTLNIEIDREDTHQIKIDNIEVKKVTFLKNEQGENYEANTIDPEGIALSPRHTLFISTEGNNRQQIAPMIAEFDLETGDLIQKLPIPQRYLPDINNSNQPQGVQRNLGFESLNIKNNSLIAVDPFRLFTATESSLLQDGMADTIEDQNPIRLMHYVINHIGQPILSSEHLYLLDQADSYTLVNGLTELITLAPEGYFLTLERNFGLLGASAKIFQVVVGNGTDISSYQSLAGKLSEIMPMKKQLLLDLKTLGIQLENLEGMVLGQKLADGSQTLILVSDDNFEDDQKTQFLLFRLGDEGFSLTRK